MKPPGAILLATLVVAWTLLATSVCLSAAMGSPATAKPKKDSSPPAVLDSLASKIWHLPKPPYPYAARARHEQGSMYIEIETGKDGRVSKASVPKSKDHPTLDLFTATWAYVKWSGPPNQKARVPITYMLR